MVLSLPEHLAAQEATGHGGVSAARFRKTTQKYEPHRCRSRRVFTGFFVITKTKSTKYYRAIGRVLGTLTGTAVAGFLLSHPMQGWWPRWWRRCCLTRWPHRRRPAPGWRPRRERKEQGCASWWSLQGHMGAVERSGGSVDGGGCRSRRGVFLLRLGRSQVSRIQINAAQQLGVQGHHDGRGRHQDRAHGRGQHEPD